MNLSNLLLELTDKLGLDQTDERLKPFLGVNIEIDDAIASEITEKLITVQAAKNNKEIKNHFVAQAYSGIDAEVNKYLEIIGDEDLSSRINTIHGTGKKTQLLLEYLNEKVKSAPAGSSDSKELKEQLKNLNAEISKYKENYIPKSDYENAINSFESERLDSIESTVFSNKKWSENYPADVRNELARIKLEKELEKLGATKVRNGKTIKLVSKENPEMDLYVDNKLVTFESLVDQIMVDNKFLAVSQPNNPNPQYNPPAGSTSQNTQNINPAFLKKLNAAKSDQGI